MKKVVIVCLLLFCALGSIAQQPSLLKVNRCIFVPQKPTAEELQAAELLKEKISDFDIVLPEPDMVEDLVWHLNNDSGPVAFVGNTLWAKSFLSRKEDVRDDGFRLHCDGRFVDIYAPQGKGVIYGAARFLELNGLAMTHPEVASLVKNHVSSPFVKIDEVNNPSFTHREMWYYTPYHSQEYVDWHGLHFRSNLQWSNLFVHTFQRLVPHQQYFEAHPEWFSEINGRRVRDGQLCLTNPEVLDTLCAHLADSIALHPEAQIWSVSNNDNINGCQCAKCRHADSLYGGPSGTLIHFINQVARRFPTKTISTLAYQYTRQAPKPVNGHIERPDSNVNIMFCSIECGRQEAIATAPREASFRQDMHDWSALTSNIYMWDYVVQFRNYWDPFPNLHVLGPNLKFFRDNGVRWMFEQGSGAQNITSWMHLRQYLLAKLMWNADANVDSLIHEFCHHYYGVAAQPIETLYHSMHQALCNSEQWLDIYGYPIDAAKGYLSPANLARYRQLIQDARDSVSRHQPQFYHKTLPDGTDMGFSDLENRRIRELELSLDFATIELTMAGVLPMDSTFLPMVENFVDDSKDFGITCLHEMGYTPDEYRGDIDGYLAKCSRTNLARGCKVELRHEPDQRYYSGGAQGLTDGRAGMLNYHNCWMGFYGDTIDAVIDMGKKCKVSSISIDFYYYPLSWIFFPQNIRFYISTDKKHWQLVGDLHPTDPEKLAVPQIGTFSSPNFNGKARYIKVVAEPLPTIPEWHRATGNPAWIFTDEIIVK